MSNKVCTTTTHYRNGLTFVTESGNYDLCKLNAEKEAQSVDVLKSVVRGDDRLGNTYALTIHGDYSRNGDFDIDGVGEMDMEGFGELLCTTY